MTKQELFKIFAGRKTTIAAIVCLTAGVLDIMGGDIADGLFKIGVGGLGYGIWSRLMYVHYELDENGKPNILKPRKRSKKIMGESEG